MWGPRGLGGLSWHKNNVFMCHENSPVEKRDVDKEGRPQREEGGVSGMEAGLVAESGPD